MCTSGNITIRSHILTQGQECWLCFSDGRGGELIGIFTERDVLYRVAGIIRDLKQITVKSLMTQHPTALKMDTAMQHALHIMSIHGFRHVPLVDDDEHPVGIISFRDIVHFIERHFA